MEYCGGGSLQDIYHGTNTNLFEKLKKLNIGLVLNQILMSVLVHILKVLHYHLKKQWCFLPREFSEEQEKLLLTQTVSL